MLQQQVHEWHCPNRTRIAQSSHKEFKPARSMHTATALRLGLLLRCCCCHRATAALYTCSSEAAGQCSSSRQQQQQLQQRSPTWLH
jgi:hypothetical protein